MLPGTTLTEIMCVHQLYIVRDKSPARSRLSHIYPVLRDHETLALKDSFSDQGPRERVVSFYIPWKSRIRSTADGEASQLGGQLE